MSARSPEDVEVFTTQVPSDRTYQDIGHIEARQSSAYSVHGQSQIIAELRARAAEKGCHGIIVTVVGSVSNGTGSVKKGYGATCIIFTGESPGNAEGAAATTSAAPEQAREAPVGVAGFEFAMTADEARLACEGSGNDWTEGARGAACSGPAENVGVDGTVQLLPCNEAFCQILVTSEPSEGELIPAVKALRNALEKRYGAPSDSDTAVPQDCRETVTECLDAQRAYLEYIWTFENGQVVKLRLGKKPEVGGDSAGADHKLRLLYTRRVPVERQIDDSALAL